MLRIQDSFVAASEYYLSDLVKSEKLEEIITWSFQLKMVTQDSFLMSDLFYYKEVLFYYH